LVKHGTLGHSTDCTRLDWIQTFERKGREPENPVNTLGCDGTDYSN